MDFFELKLAFGGFFFAMFLIIIFLGVPRSLQSYALWAKTGKASHLSNLFSQGLFISFVTAGSFIVLLQQAVFFIEASFFREFAFITLNMVLIFFLIPWTVRYFMKWRVSGKESQFVASFAFGLVTLFAICLMFILGLKPFINCPIMF